MRYTQYAVTVLSALLGLTIYVRHFPTLHYLRTTSPSIVILLTLRVRQVSVRLNIQRV
jgi:hypothetical protein